MDDSLVGIFCFYLMFKVGIMQQERGALHRNEMYGLYLIEMFVPYDLQKKNGPRLEL